MRAREAARTKPTSAAAPSRPRSRLSSAEAFIIDLQRTAGNQAVSSWLATGIPLQRTPGPKKTTKKKAPTTLAVTVDGNGRMHTADAAATLVGFKDASGAAYAVLAKDSGPATLTPVQGDPVELVKVHQVALGAPAADGTITATFSGSTAFALLDDSAAGIVVNTAAVPLKASAMPASLAADMVADTHIDLPDGTTWVLLTLPGNTLTWVAASHPATEFATRQTELETEAQNLPASMQSDFANVVRATSLVSIIEGGFGSTAGASDTSASLGIFQWAMEKNQSDETGSLGKFFSTLKSRATASQAKKAKDRTDEDTLYIDAWKQCTDAGLDVTVVKGKVQLTINGKVAQGQDVESTMAGEMAKDSLRTYQLVAAMDWLNEMKAQTVMPGLQAYGRTYVGNHYGFDTTEEVTLKGPGRSFKLGPPTASMTVGDVCSSDEALATAANVWPNRPAYVRTAVWRACAPADVDTQIKTLLTTIEAAEPAPAPAPPATGKTKKPKKPPPPPAITASTVTDKASFTQLQQLIWPTVSPDDDTVISRFEATALELYKKEGGSSYKTSRAKRLATTHVVNW
jgi:hypothetical protein